MAKGPVLQTLERVERTLVEKSVGQYHGLMDAQGTDTYGSVSLTRREQDDRWLGLWFILGQADDLVSLPWWQKLATTKPVDEVAMLDLECRRAWQDEDRRDSAMAVVGDDLRATYAVLRRVGWHSGEPRPVADEGAPPSEHPRRMRAARALAEQALADENGGYR